MYTLFPPGSSKIAALLDEADHLPFNTPLDPLRSDQGVHWDVDHYQISVAVSSGVPAAAVHSATAEIVRTLAFYPTWMLTVRRGRSVIVGARSLGVLGIFATRVVAEHDEGDDEAGGFDLGFTYATLAGHFETGVETFLARREGHGPVRFTIDAVSRPRGPLGRLISWLVVRRLQRRFGSDATAGFQRTLLARLPGP